MDREFILNHFYTNLDTIARIQDGHKLYVDSNQAIQLDEPYMFQGIWRYCYSISRKDAIHVLTKLFNDIEIYINALYLKTCSSNGSSSNGSARIPNRISKSADVEYQIFINMIEKISKALLGIANLQLTYIDDTTTCTDLKKIIDKGKSLIDNFSVMI
jgi:hypothetical protein